MLAQTISYGEQNVFVDPPKVVTVPAATATEVIPEQVGDGSWSQIAFRYIQNNSAEVLYYSFGLGTSADLAQCDNAVMYHGFIPAYGQLDCSTHRKRVCVYSVNGASVPVTIGRRNT
jgi:hypothetical protein